MIPIIKKYLLDNWGSLNLGQKPDDLYFIKFEDRRIRDPQVGIISFLVKKVSRAQEIPFLILRIPRYAESQAANLSLETEHRNLSVVREKLKGLEIQQVIPGPILWEEISSCRVLAINFLPGEDLSQRIISSDILKSYIENSSIAFNWLMDFQKALGCDGFAPGKEIIDKVVGAYTQTFPQKVNSRRSYFSKLQEKARKFSGAKIPLFVQHGDYHAENIFIVDKKVSGVIDWEDFDLQGIPGFDLFHFIRTYFEALQGYFAELKDISSIEKISSNETVLKVVRSTAQNYFQTLGIDPELIRIYLPLHLIQSASMAGSSRKRALGALNKIDILLKIEPWSIDDLLLYMSIFAYSQLSKKASAEGDQERASLCEKKIQGVLEKAKTKP